MGDDSDVSPSSPRTRNAVTCRGLLGNHLPAVDSIAGSLELDTTLASPPFDGPEGGVILRTSDSMDFWVLKPILALASPVFTTMFTLPQPSVHRDEATQPPIIPITESSSTLDLLLRLCYPIEVPRLSQQSLALIGDVLCAALKYEIELVIGRARRTLRKRAEESSESAATVYAIACHLKLEEEARIAAMACLKWPFPGSVVPQFSLMSGLDYHNLLQYHKKAGEAVVSLFTKNRYLFVTTTCTAITPSDHPCQGSKKLSYTVNNEDIEVVEYFWWTSSKTVLSEAFKSAPLATDKLSLWTLAPILEATVCTICKNKFFHGWDQTREAIIAEMRKKIGKVELALSWE